MKERGVGLVDGELRQSNLTLTTRLSRQQRRLACWCSCSSCRPAWPRIPVPHLVHFPLFMALQQNSSSWCNLMHPGINTKMTLKLHQSSYCDDVALIRLIHTYSPACGLISEAEPCGVGAERATAEPLQIAQQYRFHSKLGCWPFTLFYIFNAVGVVIMECVVIYFGTQKSNALSRMLQSLGYVYSQILRGSWVG